MEPLKYERAVSIKNLARTGWMNRGVPPALAETVAAHTFEVAFLTLLITKALVRRGIRVDLGRALTIAIIHDVPEALAGDIVKWSKDRLRGVEKLDEEALEDLGLGSFNELMREFKEKTTLEGTIVKLADHLATMLEAKRYLKRGYDVNDIINGCASTIKELLNAPALSPHKQEIRGVLQGLLGKTPAWDASSSAHKNS